MEAGCSYRLWNAASPFGTVSVVGLEAHRQRLQMRYLLRLAAGAGALLLQAVRGCGSDRIELLAGLEDLGALHPRHGRWRSDRCTRPVVACFF